jgi:S1-C subfamily serine protease
MILSRLGIVSQPLTEQQASNFQMKGSGGLFVAEIETNSPAAILNLSPGFVLVGVDNFTVAQRVKVTNALGNKKPGEKAALLVKIANRYTNGFVELRDVRIELPVR